jgi:hypothetical protein
MEQYMINMINNDGGDVRLDMRKAALTAVSWVQ